MTNNVECVFVLLSHLCVFFGEMSFPASLFSVKTGLLSYSVEKVCVLIHGYCQKYDFLIIFSSLWFVFFLSCWCLLKCQKFLTLRELQFISFIIYSYLCYLRTLCLNQESKVFSYIFLKWLYCFRFYI